MKLTTTAIVLALLAPAISRADDKTPPPQDKPKDKTTEKQPKKLGENEIKIVSHLHHVNQMEIELGKIAEKQATEPVKKYATMLVTDHTTADKSLTKLAKENGLATIPAENPTTEAGKQAMKDMSDAVAALKKLNGVDFDRAYLTMMIRGHEDELAMTDPLIELCTNSDLDMYMMNRKATLQRHTDMAKELLKSASVSTTK